MFRKSRRWRGSGVITAAGAAGVHAVRRQSPSDGAPDGQHLVRCWAGGGRGDQFGRTIRAARPHGIGMPPGQGGRQRRRHYRVDQTNTFTNWRTQAGVGCRASQAAHNKRGAYAVPCPCWSSRRLQELSTRAVMRFTTSNRRPATKVTVAADRRRCALI